MHRQLGNDDYRNGFAGSGHDSLTIVQSGQLDFRLHHLCDIAVRIRRLDQSSAISDRVVCRIAADADLDHSHYPHGKDPVSAEPREQLADLNNDYCCGRRRAPPLFPIRFDARFCSIAHSLLAGGSCDHPLLLRAGACGQDLVRAALGNVIDT